MKRTVLIVLLVFALGVSGCAKKKVATDMAAEPAEEEKKAVEIAPDKVVSEEIARVEDAGVRVESAMAGLPYEDVYFDFDRYDIKGEYERNLMKVSDWILNSNASVLIEGHCDERGTNEYNLALGDRRSEAVKDFLAASGVPSSRIETISFGEEKPVCNQRGESCWSRNRRAHIIAEGGR